MRPTILAIQDIYASSPYYNDLMQTQNSYCKAIKDEAAGHVSKIYHDEEYGFAVHSDDALFERLVLEINQAGLSWLTILKKREHFRAAYAHFSIARVATFDEEKKAQLMNNAGIIRNALKIRAALHNARVVLKLQKEHGSFAAWLESQACKDLHEWVALFKKTFTFTGGEITKEFLVSTGYLEGAHAPDCPAYKAALATSPHWSVKNAQ